MLGPVYGLGSGLGGTYQKFKELPVQAVPLTYNGTSQNVTWTYDNSQLTIVEDAGSQIHAGRYETKFKPIKPYCWPDGTQNIKNFSWTIQPAAITAPVIRSSKITYNGSFQSPDITYDSKIALNGDTLESVFITEHLSEDKAGDYDASWTIKNSDYVWAVSIPAKKTASWTIDRKPVTMPVISNTSKTYNAAVQGPSVSPATSSDWTKTDYEGTNANDYTLTVSLVDPDNTVWNGTTSSDPLTFAWSIEPVAVTKPTGTPLNFTYNAEEQGPAISHGPSASYVKRTGSLTEIDAGTYNIIYSFTCNTGDIINAYWAEDRSITDVAVTYKIDQLKIPIPTAETTSVEYNKSTYSPSISDLSDYEKYLTVSGIKSSADVGTYPVTYSIKSEHNVRVQNVTWSDYTVTPKAVTWEIVAKKLTKPTLSQSSFTFSPSGITISEYENYVDANFVTRLSDSSSNLTGYNVNNYQTVYELSCNKDGFINTTWADGTTDPVVLSWQITKLALIKPVQIKVPDYDMTLKTATWNSNFSSDYMTVTNDTEINAGTYTATFTTKYPGNAQFGSSDSVTSSWQINPQVINKPIIENGPFVYNNTEYKVSVPAAFTDTWVSPYITTTGDKVGTNAREYQLTFSLTKNSGTIVNTKWNDNTTDSFSLKWNITKAVLPSISLSESNINLTSSVRSKVITVTREGDGAIIVDNPSTTVLSTSVSGNQVTISVNSEVETTVEVKIRVAEGTNYFASTSSTEKTVTVVMSDFATRLAVKSSDIVQSNYLSYCNTTLTAEFSGYDPETMSIAGNTGKAAKDYTATIVCKTGYIFKDGVSSVAVPWTIHDYLADIPYLHKQEAITLTSKYCATNQLVTDNHKFGTGAFYCDGNPKHQLVISGFKSATQSYCWDISFWLARASGSSTTVEDKTDLQSYMPIINLCNRLYICQTGHFIINMGSVTQYPHDTDATWTIGSVSANSTKYNTHHCSDIVPTYGFRYYKILYYQNHFTRKVDGTDKYVYLLSVYIDGQTYYDFYETSPSFYGSTYADKIIINVNNCNAYIDDLRIQKYSSAASMLRSASTVPTKAQTKDSYTALLMNFDT